MLSDQQDVMQPFAALALPEPAPLVRNRKLLRILVWSLPAVIVAAAGGGWLVALSLWASAAGDKAVDGRWQEAESSFSSLARVTPVFPETWLTQYNVGTSLLALGDLDGGILQLAAAYEGVPKAKVSPSGTIQPFSYECSVRMNLSFAYETAGDNAANDKVLARQQYEEALTWAEPCQIEGSDGDDDPEDDESEQGEQFTNEGGQASDRLREKLQDLEEDDPSEGEGPEEDPSGGESQEQQQKREELEDKNQEQQERVREQEEQRNRHPGTGGW